MGRVQVVLERDIEMQLRNRMSKKGDLSKIINKALVVYFSREGL